MCVVSVMKSFIEGLVELAYFALLYGYHFFTEPKSVFATPNIPATQVKSNLIQHNLT